MENIYKTPKKHENTDWKAMNKQTIENTIEQKLKTTMFHLLKTPLKPPLNTPWIFGVNHHQDGGDNFADDGWLGRTAWWTHCMARKSPRKHGKITDN